jgi:phosphoribosyl 1,2-cyclic phosphate phosphodiesterase
VCREARRRGVPYSRSGPSAFLHDINLLIDTPAEISAQLNRAHVRRVDYLTFTHLDPDHVEGLRVVEQIALDFRSWRAYPEKRVCLLLPEELVEPLRSVRSQYGPVVDFYEESGFLRVESFRDRVKIDGVGITAIPIDRGRQMAFVQVFEMSGRRVVYAPCDLKPFPEHRSEVQGADLLIIQPGIFERGLRRRYRYPPDHVSRSTLYTFEQTLELAERVRARKVLFVHLEEYWNRSYDDYRVLERRYPNVRFAYDGMTVNV